MYLVYYRLCPIYTYGVQQPHQHFIERKNNINLTAVPLLPLIPIGKAVAAIMVSTLNSDPTTFVPTGSGSSTKPTTHAIGIKFVVAEPHQHQACLSLCMDCFYSCLTMWIHHPTEWPYAVHGLPIQLPWLAKSEL